MNFLLGVCGGIAAYKSVYVASKLKRQDHCINVVMTEAAVKFVNPLTFETICNAPVAYDMFALKNAYSVEHIELAKRAEFAVLAPATANTIAKLAAGLADNMLTTVFLALKCKTLLVPAMNTAMYENPATQANINILKSRGYIIMEPSEGKLACGDEGKGRMPEPDEIIEFINANISKNRVLKGKKLLVTAGPTREPIDPVRYISNRSSGKMGYAIAKTAVNMGASVTLVSGPTALMPPGGVQYLPVITAEDMKNAILDNKDNKDAIIMCAAVADYTPKVVCGQKIKKTHNLTIELIKTPDILSELGNNKNCLLVGFAAETNNLETYAKKKLKQKNLDMIVANDVSSSETGFDSDENAVTIITRDGTEKVLDKASKLVIAYQILLELSYLLNRN